MTINIHKQRILILDFGSQYVQLIARRVRELGVYCEIHPFDITDDTLNAFAPNGIILSGGPESVTFTQTPRAPQRVFELGCPVFGICYGMQTMVQQLGGHVESSTIREFGYATLSLTQESDLLKDIHDHVADDGTVSLDVWMSHGDKVISLPPGFVAIASTPNTPIAAMMHESLHWYGVQFHPEVTHTRQGIRILEHFIRRICGCERLWVANNIVEDMIERISAEVGSDQVILGLSGGVDSAVVAALMHRAIKDQLVCVFVDNGLLRLDESVYVLDTFVKHFGINVIRVDASQDFLQALKGVTDPEEKRKIIGKQFIDAFAQAAKKYTHAKFLAQGTIYTDVIESAATKFGAAHVIKSHHNVGGLPPELPFKLIEPLRELFKDEVRQIGLELGLPYDWVYRHPFPGPGLGVRVLGEVREEYLEILRKADAIFMDELHKQGWYFKVSQAFSVFMPVKSVGVVGDARQYEYVIALRAVETLDFMTARWAHLPYELLGHVSNRIINEVPGVSRVTYDISSKPPATIEWE